MIRTTILAVLCCAASVAAFAQAPSAPADDGFFRPQPDPALTPARAASPPSTIAPRAAALSMTSSAAAGPSEPTAAQVQLFQSQQQALDVQRRAYQLQQVEAADRDVRMETERLRTLGQLAAPINGAFTGSTDPRER